MHFGRMEFAATNAKSTFANWEDIWRTRVGGFCFCRRGFNCFDNPGEWNSRRQKPSPPSWTGKTFELTRDGGFCSCRRGFNRQLRWDNPNPGEWNSRRQKPSPPSWTGKAFELTRDGGFCFCRRGLNRQLRWVDWEGIWATSAGFVSVDAV
jgi:hypothetical protein